MMRESPTGVAGSGLNSTNAVQSRIYVVHEQSTDLSAHITQHLYIFRPHVHWASTAPHWQSGYPQRLGVIAANGSQLSIQLSVTVIRLRSTVAQLVEHDDHLRLGAGSDHHDVALTHS